MLVGNGYRCCCKIKSYLQQHFSFLRRAIRGVPNISIFRFKRSGLMQKAWFLNTSNRPARAARFISVLCKLIMWKQQTGQPFLSCPVLFSGLMQQPLCSSLIQSSAGPRPLSRNGRCLCPSQPLGGTAVSRSGNSFRTMVFLTRQDNPRLTPYRKQEPGRWAFAAFPPASFP